MRVSVPVIILGISAVLMSCFCFPVSADFSYGARAAAMGGAYVALADDASGVYWNPAAAAMILDWSVGLEYGSELEVAEDVQNTLDIFAGMSPGDMPEEDLAAFLKNVDGFSWMARGGDRMGFAIANMKTSLTINGYQVYYVEPEVDEDVPGDSMWRFTGIDVQEYGINYAWMNPERTFSMGLNAKYIDLKGYNGTAGMWDLDSYDAGDMVDYVENGSITNESDWGVDVGLLFFYAQSRFGITGKNLNSYSLKFEDGTEFKIKPEYRVGYAYMPTNRFTYSLDYSFNKNRTPLGESLDGSEVAMGFEGIFGESRWLILRGGASMEVSGDTPLLFSGGMGLKFTNVIFDFAYVTDADQDSEKLWGGIRIFFKQTRGRR